MFASIPALLLDLLLLSLMGLLGARALHSVAPRAGRVEKLAAAFPLGAGLFTFSVFLASWAGLEIRLTTLAVVFAILLFVFLAAGRWRAGDRRDEPLAAGSPELGRLAFLRWVPWAVIATLTLTSAVISLGRSYTPFDASAIWAAKGYGMALEGTIFAARSWGAHSLSYPLNVPLLISSFQLVDGDILPGSKLLFPLFYASTLLGALGFWRRLRLSNGWLCAGVLLLGTIPEVFRHSTYGYVNIPASAYLVLGTLWGVSGLIEGSRERMTVAGLLLGLGCWTRVEGILYALVISGALAVAWLRLRTAAFPFAWLMAPLVIVGGTWLFFYRSYGVAGTQAGEAMAAAIAGWKAGDLHLHSLRLILGYFRRVLFDTETWGLLFPLSAALLLLHLRRLYDRAFPILMPLGLATLVTGVGTAGLFYVGSYARGDLVGWMTRGFPRAFFPAAILLVILSLATAAIESRPRNHEVVAFEAGPTTNPIEGQ